MNEKKYLLTVEDESIADDNALRQVIQTARYHGFEVSEYVERTCEMIDIKSGDRADYDCDEHIFHCRECHAERGVYAYNEDGDVWAEMPKHCPECGVRVVER